MKLLSYDNSKWAWVPRISVWVWMTYVWYCILRDVLPKGPNYYFQMVPPLIVTFLMVLVDKVLRNNVPPTVYDDDDAIVVIKRLKQIRIPFSNISRVSYKSESGRQSVILEFLEPCELGSRFEFQVSAYFKSPPHLDVADDLHRRSRCCKEQNSHGPIDHSNE